ncbi:hypothetical protein M378DRAFT_18225 [Amanita muscaria Koide BX008]|uniref:Uncharacterized protein n=1 Tax=Amanita muscaria (strain Koide BX008) TaxID=946122 RepID=A0A0C2WEX3_AMAMK|nr:hypothetical protein M378DRAFT_18225 [Amanita muscaria Koide BX008]
MPWSRSKLTVPVPSCFPLDLMHLASLNIPQHLIEIWRGSVDGLQNGDHEFVVLKDDATWQEHGALVASMRCYLPDSFSRPPRNPAEKINTQYKATKFLTYFWVLGPALFRLVLPHHLWQHFCKLVCGIRIVHQRTIALEDLMHADKQLIEWETEFEKLYYGRQLDRLHLVRPSIHLIAHAARETVRCGPLNLLAQWALENTIGNLGREVRQHSNPFSNLAERAVQRSQLNALHVIVPGLEPCIQAKRGSVDVGDGYTLLQAHDKFFQEVPVEEANAIQHYTNEQLQDIRIQKWARLHLPNGQLARSAWKERARDKDSVRAARNVIQENVFFFGEVQYYFQSHIHSHLKTLALISIYQELDANLFAQSHNTLRVYRYDDIHSLQVIDVHSIQSVVAMIPFPCSRHEIEENKYLNSFFISEKVFLEYTLSEGRTEENDGDDNEGDNSDDGDDS